MNSILNLQNVIQGFKLSCQTENRSPKTIEWYDGFLDRLYQFLKRNNHPTSVKRISKDHIRTFILFLQQKEYQEKRMCH